METTDYLDVFLEESDEHLQAINNHLLELEKNPENLEMVHEIFRSAHTLKGMAGTMQFQDIASLTHQMENVFDKMRNNELKVNEHVVDIIFQAVEALEQMVEAIRQGESGSMDVTALVSHLKDIEGGDDQTELEHKAAKEQFNPHMNLDEYQMTVVKQAIEQGFTPFQITVNLSEDCLLKAARVYMVFEVFEEFGEIIKSVPAVEELEAEEFETQFSVVVLSKAPAAEIEARVHTISEIESVTLTALDMNVKKAMDKKTVQDHLDKTKESQSTSANNNGKHTSSKTIRVSSERIDQLMNLFEELVLDRGRLEDISAKKNDLELTETVEHIAKVSQDMQDLILTMRMVPVEQVFNRFPRMVRGLAKDLGKNIDLEIIGADTELDRTVIDEIGDPLVHLIRNSIDHGIETEEARRRAGKPSNGKLILRAYHSGNHVFIEIEDDGAGINREKVVQKAIENGLITGDRAEELKDEDVYQLILASGFSTADKVSDISGRGVGLDAVSNKIAALGGHIFIESDPGRGSKFSIQLPLTLSILSSLLVHVQKEIFGIPLSSVVETVLLNEQDIMYSHRQQVMDFRGKIIPLLSLKEVLEVPGYEQDKEQKHLSVVIVKKGERMTGLIVDAFIGKKEVVLKSLGNYLKGIFAISGATILGNGQVSLIIDPNALVK
ncbi:chemotaxis protein CheA [Virgibacillus sp. YIM 98842]|uniref:chemotaxis protein CheA n=1 Tax=Virgibacillus sp. YIM 98842 TaxID=2663533 RepID=UPI0013DB2D32|nr:chemotaxis protein CheA [Virgibacillus sp. YIM 98842]